MNHWPFVLAAYVVTVATAALLTVWAYATMRRAEAAVGRYRAADVPEAGQSEGKAG